MPRQLLGDSPLPVRPDEHDSPVCRHGGCTDASAWRYWLGDLSEHIARINLCERDARVFDTAPRLPCTLCGKQMKIEKKERM